jgi:hypothetical protein
MQENGPSLDEQMCLLSLGSSQEGRNGSELASNDVKNAVLFTSDVLNGNRNRKLLPQYGLIGEVQSSGMESVSDDPRLFVNTNHPWQVKFF